jgi:hypothetical protein
MGYHAEAYYKAEHRDHPAVIHTDDDVDALIDELLGEPFDNSMANLYLLERLAVEGSIVKHEFGVAVDAEDGVGSLSYLGDGMSWTSQGGRSERDEVFYCFVGHEREFPIDSLISIDLIRQATKEWLASGGERPGCVQWQPNCVSDDG